MDKEKVLDLAKLARIKISDEEAENLSHEFESILKYVGEVSKFKKVNKLDKEKSPIRNVMREDGEAHKGRVGGEYIKVKKIL
ncbi:MAG TPA: hypothetical protein VJJ48_02510 [Candidatus Paceibacterota bacterium]